MESTAPFSSRSWWFATLAAILVIVGLFAHTLSSRHVLSSHDAAHMYVPIKDRVAASYLNGEWPLWNADVGCGTPFLANPMVQGLYPGNVVFLVFDALLGIKIFVILHLVLTVLAFRLLCRSFGASASASTVGGLFFATCGAVLSMHWNLMWVAGFPWTLLAMVGVRRVLHEEGGVRATIFLGGSVGLAILACAFELLLAFAYYAFVESLVAAMRRFRRAESEEPRSVSAFGWLAGSAVLAMGIGAIQLLPTFELASRGARAGGLAAEHAQVWATPLARLLEGVAPGLFGNAVHGSSWSTVLFDGAPYHQPFLTGIYFGAPALVLALFGAVYAGRGVRACLVGMAAVCATLSLGSATFVFDWARDWLPGVAFFRYPTKILICAMIPVGILASLGWDVVMARARSPMLHRVLLWSVSVLMLLTLLGVFVARESIDAWLSSRLAGIGLALDPRELTSGAGWALFHGFLVVSVCALVIEFRSRLSGRALAMTLVAIMVGDLVWSNRQLVPTCHPQALLQRPSALPTPEALERPGHGGPLRIAAVLNADFHHFYQPYHALLHGYRFALDYGAVDLGTHVDLYRALAGKQDRQFALSSVALRLSTPPGEIHMDAIEVEEIPEALPRALVVPRVSIASDLDVAGAYLASDVFRPHEEAVLLDAPAELGRIGRGEGADSPLEAGVRRVFERSGHVAFEVHSSRAAFFLMTDSFYPGWSAFIDGTEVDHYRANLAFRALPIPAGRHVVEFRYDPRGFVVGAIISAISIGVVLLGFVLLRRAGRRDSSDDSVREVASEVEEVQLSV